MKKYRDGIISLLILNLLAGCPAPGTQPAGTPTPSASPVPSATATPGTQPTPTTVPTPSSTPVNTPVPTVVPTFKPPETTGDEIKVNPLHTLLNNDGYSISRSSNGEFLFVWKDQNSEIYGRKYNINGEPQTQEIRLSSIKGDNPKAGMDKDGNFVIIWTSEIKGDDPYNNNVYLKRFKSNGDAIGNEILINNLDIKRKYREADISMNDTGDFAVSWTGYAKYTGDLGSFQPLYDSIEIYSQKFTAKAIQINNIQEIKLDTTTGEHRVDTGIDRDGNYLIAWNNNSKLHLRKYDKDGRELRTLENIASNLSGPSVEGAEASSHTLSVNENGNFALAWFSVAESGSQPALKAKLFTSNLTPFTGEIPVNNGDRSFTASTAPALVIDRNQGLFISLIESIKLPAGTTEPAVLTGKTNLENTVINLFKINQFISPNSIDQKTGLITDGSGNMLVSWEAYQGIFFKKFKFN
jgi:hypothetical protein